MKKEKYNEQAIIIGKPRIGKGTWIGPFTIIDGSGGLEIGRNCDISAGVHIYSHSTAKRCVGNKKFNTDNSINREIIERQAVKIGDHTFVGAKSIILMGVQIGSHSIIGAGSVVTKDIPDFSVAVGSPAKVIGKVIIDNDDVKIKITQKSKNG